AELARQDWQALGRGEPPPLAVREPQLAQAPASLAAAQAALRSAELDLNRASIRAPFTGRIRERRANVGDYVSPGSPVAVMFSTETMEIRVPLTDADLASMRLPVGFTATAANPGPTAHVTTTNGGPPRAWAGPPARPRVSARVEGANSETLVAAPRSALKRNEFVYVVAADDTIDVRQVRPAQTTADEVLFREGVADGERVVVSVLTSPRQGMAVTPINRA